MNQVWFRFYEELNDFLPASRKKQLFPHSFEGNPSVKDVIESLGVPHIEVDLILINGVSAGFTQKLTDGDRVSVYPVFETIDITDVQHLRKHPLRIVKFITDVHLGKLTKYLRMAGFDTKYDRIYNDDQIIDISVKEKRIILTRDKMLLHSKRINHGCWVRSTDPRKQMKEITERFDLRRLMKPFTRCLECNTPIREVSKEDVYHRLPPRTREYFNIFWKCNGCGRIYWEGSHYERMKAFTESLQKLKTNTEEHGGPQSATEV